MKRLSAFASLTVAVAACVCCQTTAQPRTSHRSHLGHVTRAIAVLAPTDGNTVGGTVSFAQEGSTVTVTAHIIGLEPNTEHAWHIHEYGDISDPRGLATGGHYNPEGHPHSLPPAPQRHAGDFGNLRADATGRAHKVITLKNVTLAGDMNPIVGHGVIVHAKRDDGGQPTGNAGARIAQGVIGVAKPE